MKKACKTAVLAVIFILAYGAASCRQEPAAGKAKIEKIIFEEPVKSIYVGDMVKVNITVNPDVAKVSSKIEFGVTEAGIVEIMEGSGFDGVVFRGLKRGTTVITAKSDGVVDYCNVIVLGANESIVPHIIVPNYVIECRENQRHSIVASLAGGTPLDDSGFIWTNSDRSVISLENTGNVGVFDTLSAGKSIVNIRHVKAQFSVNVLVYVIGSDEIPVYITTDNNVVNITTKDLNYQYAVELRGGDSNDYYAFRHELIDGNNVIEMRYNNNIGTINPLAKGVARIRVRHPKAEPYYSEIVVIVNEELDFRYIDVDKTLMILEEGKTDLLTARIAGNAPASHVGGYTYENDNPQVISVEQSQGQFLITALQKGRSVIKVKNREYADFDREVLVIVNGPLNILDNEIYISTNQNVITTEAGDTVQLTMTLTGQETTTADPGGFVWTVDDGSVITVESAHGRVDYKNRATVNGIGEKFEAKAVIKAVKTGTAKITLEHPKAKNTFTIIVKVYRKGVFDAVPVVVNGPSVFKIETGERLPVYLAAVAGNERNLTNVQWSSSNELVVKAEGSGLNGVLEGKNQGIAEIKVKGDNQKDYYTALVIVGGESYLDSVPYIFVLNPFMQVIKGNTFSFKVLHEHLTKDEISDITVTNNTRDKIEVFAYKDSVTVTGLELGRGEIVITSGANTLNVYISVEEYAVNPDMPYYLRAEKFIYGLSKEHPIELTVELVGGGTLSERQVIWNIENANIAVIEGMGVNCLLTGRNEGQTVLKVSHPKSSNDLELVIYVVNTDSEINSTLILYTKETNILMETGETKYISVITNATSAQQNSFQWSHTNYDDVIKVNVSEDRIKAYIEPQGIGNSSITVRSGNKSLVIYVSVINSTYQGTYINVPSIVEVVAGDKVTIDAVTKGISDEYSIKWTVKDESIATIYGNGRSCMVSAQKRGSTVIKLEYTRNGFEKDILLYVYGSIEEMANSYIIAGEQSRYIINKGDIINIGLVFGMKGFPDYEMHNIWWGTEDSVIIGVERNGRQAQVKGLNVGIGIIKAGSSISNEVEIEIEVRDNNVKVGQYWFSIKEKDRLIGLIAGGNTQVNVEVYHGNSKVYNISGIEYVIEKPDIVSIRSNGEGMLVTAAAGKEGQSYITIQHDLVGEIKILVYTALSEFGLQNAYPVYTEKTNYLLKKGESIDVAFRTKDNNSGNLNNISYVPERNNGTVRVSEKNKKEIVIEGINSGSDVVLVKYNAVVVQRIYVSVTENSYGESVGYMVTESIIGMVVGSEYETFVQTDAYTVNWKKQNDYIIDIVSVEVKSAVIKGRVPGKTILTVSSGDTERSIVVFVCATVDELNNYEAINIDQRKYRIKKNESVTVNITSYQGRVESGTRYGDYYNNELPYGGVIAINAVEDNKLSFTGKNEGMAAIRISHAYYRTEIIIYVEVLPVSSGNINNIDSRHYITASKTLYIIGEDDHNVDIRVDVVGDNFNGENYWVWSGYDENIINVRSSGRGAIVNPVNEGRTKIQVSNWECSNILEITITVGERFNSNDNKMPYIYVEKTLYEILIGTENMSISYNIMNLTLYDKYDVRYTISGNSVNVRHYIEDEKFYIEPRESGVSQLLIEYGSLQRIVYILVKDNLNIGNIYLTTSENYIAASVGELKTVTIKLEGYDEQSSGNFNWSVYPQNGVITVVGNGITGQIYGVGEGEAVITVRHAKAEPYPLKINVRVVKDKVKESLIYLTTQRNVIETVVGKSVEQIYIQKVGGDLLNSQTTWTVSDSSIVNVTGSGYSAHFIPGKEGVARIQARNIESDYVLEIVVIVKPSLNNNIYIDSGDNLLMLSPGELQKRISVVLVNGDVKDNNKFRWSIDMQQPSDPNVAAVPGSRVINIVGSNQECFINTINEGVARIRVSNEKAELPLIITVYVTHYKEIKFSVSKKEIIIGENEFVGINLPTYEYLGDKAHVWVEKTDGSSGSDICEVFYTNELVLLSGKRAGNVIVKAEVEGKEGQAQLYVTVRESADPDVNRIIIGKTVYVLNPRSAPEILNAIVGGPNMFDRDNDQIEWKIEGDRDIISIIPKYVGAKEGVDAQGRQVQITPLGIGTATITVKHSYVSEEHWKEISIIIAEVNNVFSISRSIVEVNSLRPETVFAQIIGGTTKDYNEVKWIARMQQKWDGTMLEIVRIMGSGREVVLYPMNDGETEVIAVYGKHTAVIKVKVVSDYFFSFRNGNEFMYPGEIRDLPFDIRPANATPNWINADVPGEEPVITYAEVLGSKPSGNGNVERYVQVKALREGTSIITGMANGKIAQARIVVQFNYSFNSAANLVVGSPKYYGMVDNDLVDEDGICEVEYTVYPPNTYIMPVGVIPQGLTVEVEAPVIKNADDTDIMGGPGIGKIRFIGLKEMRGTIGFQQYKARADNNEPPMVISGGVKYINYLYRFEKNITVTPYFIRGDGVFSNIITKSDGSTEKQPQFITRDGRSPANAESIKNNKALGDNAYSLSIGDGEEHYILFDKPYETAEMEIMGIVEVGERLIMSYSPGDRYTNSDFKDFELEIVGLEIDGIMQKALRISGGPDHIVYNRAKFPQKLYMEVWSDSVASGAVSVVTERIYLYQRVFPLIYNTLIKKHEGPWAEVTANKELPAVTYYLLRDMDLAELETVERYKAMNTYNPIRITEVPELLDYYESYTYTYCYKYENYFSSNETNQYVYRNFLLDNCDKYDVYPLLYTYLWQYYIENRETFDNSGYVIDTSKLLYKIDSDTGEETDEIIGGTITTLFQTGGEVNEIVKENSLLVYEYNKEYLSDLLSMNKISANLLYSSFDDERDDFDNWDMGLLTENLLQQIPDYNENSVYSTIQRWIDGVRETIGGTSTQTSRYDVFKRRFVDSNNNLLAQGQAYGVYLDDSNISTSYQYGAGFYNHFQRFCMNTGDMLGQSIQYRGMQTLPFYDFNASLMTRGDLPTGSAKNDDLRGYVTKAHIWARELNNGNNSHKSNRLLSHSKNKVFVESKFISHPGGGHYETVYDYYYYPSGVKARSVFENNKPESGLNKESQNIFGNSYGQWSDYYRPTVIIAHHDRGLGDSCRLNSDNDDTGWRTFYGKATAAQRLFWQDTGSVIVPYYFFNRFPYRYEQYVDNNYRGNGSKTVKVETMPTMQIVKLSDGGGKPMPSINKTATSLVQEVTIRYRVFNYTGGQSSPYDGKAIKLTISFEKRPCHMMYDGSKTVDSEINYMGEYGSWDEIEGPVQDWSQANNFSTDVRVFID